MATGHVTTQPGVATLQRLLSACSYRVTVTALLEGEPVAESPPCDFHTPPGEGETSQDNYNSVMSCCQSEIQFMEEILLDSTSISTTCSTLTAPFKAQMADCRSSFVQLQVVMWEV